MDRVKDDEIDVHSQDYFRELRTFYQKHNDEFVSWWTGQTEKQRRDHLREVGTMPLKRGDQAAPNGDDLSVFATLCPELNVTDLMGADTKFGVDYLLENIASYATFAEFLGVVGVTHVESHMDTLERCRKAFPTLPFEWREGLDATVFSVVCVDTRKMLRSEAFANLAWINPGTLPWLVFGDEILVYSKTAAIHKRHMELTLSKLESIGATCKVEPDMSGKSEVLFANKKIRVASKRFRLVKPKRYAGRQVVSVVLEEPLSLYMLKVVMPQTCFMFYDRVVFEYARNRVVFLMACVLAAVGSFLQRDAPGRLLSSSTSGCAVCAATEMPNGGALALCGGCHDARYCSPQHQRQHWKEHKKMCKKQRD